MESKRKENETIEVAADDAEETPETRRSEEPSTLFVSPRRFVCVWPQTAHMRVKSNHICSRETIAHENHLL